MVHRTMQGKEIDFDKLAQQNELMPAIGNMRVNARGDELGPGGAIVRKREDVVADYYETNPNAAHQHADPVVAPILKEDMPVAAPIATAKAKKTLLEE